MTIHNTVMMQVAPNAWPIVASTFFLRTMPP